MTVSPLPSLFFQSPPGKNRTSFSPRSRQKQPILCYYTHDISCILSHSATGGGWHQITANSPLLIPAVPGGHGTFSHGIMDLISCYSGAPWPPLCLLLTVGCNLRAARDRFQLNRLTTLWQPNARAHSGGFLTFQADDGPRPRQEWTLSAPGAKQIS